MAENIAFKITVDTEVGELSVGELKESFKQLQQELSTTQAGTEKYKQTLAKMGEVRGSLKDLKDDIKALDPDAKFKSIVNLSAGITSGFQAAQGAVALFGSESEDLAKVIVKVQSATALAQGVNGLKGLTDSFRQFGLVLKANPIMLIGGIIIAIGTALFALKDKIAIVGKAFDWIGEQINTVVQAGKDFLDWIGIASFKADEMHEKTVKNAEKQATAVQERYERQIKYAKAAGLATDDLEKKMHEAHLKDLERQAREIYFKSETFAKTRKLNEEEQQLVDDLKKKMIDGFAEIQVARISANKTASDAEKKALDEQAKNYGKFLEDRKKWTEEHYWELQKLHRQAGEDSITKLQEGAKQLLEDNPDPPLIYPGGLSKDEWDKQGDDIEAEEKRRAQARWQIASDSAMAIKSLGDLLFQHQIDRAKGNEAKTREIQKKAFNFNKAIGITETVINTIKGISNALATYPYPYNLVVAALAGALGTAQTVKIASQKFPEGEASGGGAGTISTPNTSGGTAPNIESPQKLNTQSVSVNQNAQGQFTGFGNQGQESVRAYVVETDITNKQKTIRSIEERTTF